MIENNLKWEVWSGKKTERTKITVKVIKFILTFVIRKLTLLELQCSIMKLTSELSAKVLFSFLNNRQSLQLLLQYLDSLDCF
jgi:hypothetical protein